MGHCRIAARACSRMMCFSGSCVATYACFHADAAWRNGEALSTQQSPEVAATAPIPRGQAQFHESPMQAGAVQPLQLSNAALAVKYEGMQAALHPNPALR